MDDLAIAPYTYDDDLIQATRADGRPRARVYRLADTAVVLGSGSRPDVELHLDACRADGVPILRRRGGGCAVVLDPGNVIVSAGMTGLPFGHHRRHFDMLTDWLTAGLERIGIPGVNRAGICDLAVGDRKVGGACLHRSSDLLYYSASLLVDPDMARVTRYLAHPPREPGYRLGRSHRNFMGVLAPAPGSTHAIMNNRAEQVATQLRLVLQPPVPETASTGRTAC